MLHSFGRCVSRRRLCIRSDACLRKILDNLCEELQANMDLSAGSCKCFGQIGENLWIPVKTWFMKILLGAWNFAFGSYNVEAHESTEDLYRERLILLCLGIPTLFCFARFKGKWTPDKILSLLCVIVNRSYIWTSCNNTCRYKQTNVLSRTAIITSHYSESYSRIVSVESNTSIERATITTGIHYSCTCTYSDFNIHWLLQFY